MYGFLPAHKVTHRDIDKVEQVLVNGKPVPEVYNWNEEEGWAVGCLMDPKTGKAVSDPATGMGRWVRHYGTVKVEWKVVTAGAVAVGCDSSSLASSWSAWCKRTTS